MLKLLLSGTQKDMNLVLAWEEVEHERRVNVTVERLMRDETDIN